MAVDGEKSANSITHRCIDGNEFRCPSSQFRMLVGQSIKSGWLA